MPSRSAAHEFCLQSFAKNLFADQRNIWTSPLHLRALPASEKKQFALFGGATLGLVASDKSMMRNFGSTPLAHSSSFSNYGLVGMVGGAASLYFRGVARGDAHSREAGLLAGEATIDSAILAETLKISFQRPRPNAAHAGRFGAGGNSFPSEHAIVAWSIATVIAHEYPGPMTKLLAYGMASGISMARVAGRDHFPSDVVVGAALGYLVGRYVYGSHHDPELAGVSSNRLEKVEREKAPSPRTAAELGSPSVPLDSWVYAAFDRLAALGYAPSAYANLRPWTRMECARIVAAAGEELGVNIDLPSDLPSSSLRSKSSTRPRAVGDPAPKENDHSRLEADGIYAALAAEFTTELGRLNGSSSPEIRVESIYTRYMGVAGTPLDDGYHFGQTLTNDFGRLYGRGSNVVSGGSASGTAGLFAFYVRGEYQHAAALPAYSEAVQQMIGAIDVTPPQDPIHTSLVDRFRLLDAYATFNFKTVQLSAGRQSLWWGPGQGGPANFSDNVAPIDMVRFTNPSPWRLPSFFHWLGPMRWDSFLGVMAGHHYPPLPAIQGQKLSFKPTPNLEFGFSRTIVFRPLTLRTWWRGFVSFGDNRTTIPGGAADVGDRKGGFDFSYRIPGLRRRLVLYNDGMTDDDTSPLGEPQRALMSPGIYLPQIPKISKLDFRAEVAWSDPPAISNRGGKYVYYNGAYHDSYTNDGHLVGSWVGREGHGLELWSTYWLSPQSPLQVGYRKAHVDRDFIPGGGRIEDWFVRATFRLRPEFEIKAFLQHERWTFTLLSPLAGPNTVGSIELTWHPQWRMPLKFR